MKTQASAKRRCKSGYVLTFKLAFNQWYHWSGQRWRACIDFIRSNLNSHKVHANWWPNETCTGLHQCLATALNHYVGLINKGRYGMFFDCTALPLANRETVSPSLEPGADPGFSEGASDKYPPTLSTVNYCYCYLISLFTQENSLEGVRRPDHPWSVPGSSVNYKTFAI